MSGNQRTTGVDPDALEPTIDLDLQMQKQILLLEARLVTDDYYKLLGVARNADKKDIRSAYFDCMHKYHADKFFGKKLGGFTPRLQRIVTVLTKANDVLSRNKTRAEYDRYLENRERTLGARVSVAPQARESDRPEGVGVAPAVERVKAPIDVIPKAPRAPILDDTLAAALGAEPTLGPGAQIAPPPNSNKNSRSDAARRLLARKMGRKSPIVPAATPSETDRATPAQVRQALDADLKARYEARLGAAKNRSAKYLEQAATARAAGEWAAAVGAIKLALEHDPENREVQRLLDAYQAEADRTLAPKFTEQAKYEEREGLFDRAARSYERAARGKRSPELFHAGAKCLLKLGKLPDIEARKAVELARQAVTLDNQRADYRVTLARAYDVAGMRTSAVGELRRALEIAPSHDEAKELYKLLK